MKRRMLGIIAGTLFLLVLGTGSVFADNPNRPIPAQYLFSSWGPLNAAPPANQEPIAEPGKSNNYSNLYYYQPLWYGASLPH